MNAASSSSASTESEEPVSLQDLLAQRHAKYITLPEELCPASRPTSPAADGRVAALKTEVVALVHVAGGDTTNPKWGYISRRLRLACTSRGYGGAPPHGRIGEGRTADVGKDFEWEMPETEEGWAVYEERWNAAVAAEAARKEKIATTTVDMIITKTTTKANAETTTSPHAHTPPHLSCDKVVPEAVKTSKYFQAPLAEPRGPDPGHGDVAPEPEPEAEPEPEPPQPAPAPKPAKTVRDKVERWQAKVVTVPNIENTPSTQVSAGPSQSPPAARKGKARETAAPQPSAAGEKVQTSLGFRVAKRSSVQSAKGDGAASSKPKAVPPARPPTPPTSDPAPLPTVDEDPPPPADAESGPAAHVEQPAEPAPLPRIVDLPEQSFLPPSFPSQLETSTPQERRHKPPPIAPCSPPSPISEVSFNASRPQRRPPHPASSSPSAVSVAPNPAKRARTPDASISEMQVDTSPRSPSGRSPPAKKARKDSHPAPSAADVSANLSLDVPAPPSTPPPASSPLCAPVTPVSNGKGLGNAKGLPVPTTPDPNASPLPTLTDLLATSRRTRKRPRPPSRKRTPHHRRTHEPDARAQEADESEGDGASTPEPSPSKTYFSSPASGSSDSEVGDAVRARSPESPLFAPLAHSHVFSQDPGAFAPRFVSSQKPSGQAAVDADDDPFAMTQPSAADADADAGGAGLAKGSSGFFAMGYSSQFDVEGRVEQVSEILERDVDFNGWLRDLGSDHSDHEADEDRES